MWGANESSTVHRATFDSQGKESDCCRHGARDKYRKDGGDGVPGPERELRMRTIPNTGTASVSRSDSLTKFERSRSYGLTRKEIRTGKYSRLLNISHH